MVMLWPLTPLSGDAMVMLWMRTSMSMSMSMMMTMRVRVDTWKEMQLSMPCHLHCLQCSHNGHLLQITDTYFASMQQGMHIQIEGLASQMQNQMNLGFQNRQQQMTQHFNVTMFQPMMTQMRSVQENLHSDIAAMDTRFDDFPSSEQFQQLEERQQQLQQSFDTFNTAFTGFSDHFYSVFPAPVPPAEFYPYQSFYPPPPPMDD